MASSRERVVAKSLFRNSWPACKVRVRSMTEAAERWSACSIATAAWPRTWRQPADRGVSWRVATRSPTQAEFRNRLSAVEYAEGDAADLGEPIWRARIRRRGAARVSGSPLVAVGLLRKARPRPRAGWGARRSSYGEEDVQALCDALPTGKEFILLWFQSVHN